MKEKIKKIIKVEQIENFAKRLLVGKDEMHDISHLKRVLIAAKFLSKNYKPDAEVLTYGAYLHVISYDHKIEIIEFLKSQNLSKQKIDRIVQVGQESKSGSSKYHVKAETIEGKILHDANLIEGGKTFMVTKSLITGTTKGQSLQQTIDYIENNVLGKFKCYLLEAQEAYEKKEKFTKEFLKDLKESL
ncbi:MAG: hypothetical protein ABH967_00225 [Patescibacteria group bacterium]